MAGKLSADDRAFIRALRDANVLQDVDGHRLDQREGVILVACSDGDRFCDVFAHQCKMQVGHRSDPRVHVLSWHGGALACAPQSPINRRKGADAIFLDQIGDARKLKEINTVALYAHAPCGAAGMNGVVLSRVIALQIRAKLKVRTLNEGIQVGCFFHVDYGNGQKRTYFLSRPDWEMWAGANGFPAVA